MIIGDRGQVTIPKPLREKFGLGPRTEVEFLVVGGELVIRRKAPAQREGLAGWVGYLDGDPGDVDAFVEQMRGR